MGTAQWVIAVACVCSAPWIHAQEVGRGWSTALSADTTEAGIRAHLRAMGDPFGHGLPWQVRSQQVDAQGITYGYAPVPQPIQIGEWSYEASGQRFAELAPALLHLQTLYPGSVGCPATETMLASAWTPRGRPEDIARGHQRSERAQVSVRMFTRSGGTACALRTRVSPLYRQRTVECPHPPLLSWNDDVPGCVPGWWGDAAFERVLSYRSDLLPRSCNNVGNPCNPSTGDKHQTEHDLYLPWIRFVRHYHSASSTPGAGLGAGWTHEHNVRLSVGAHGPTGLVDGDGSSVGFSQIDGRLQALDDSGDVLRADGTGWKLLRRQQHLYFSAQGTLLYVERADGSQLHYQRDGNGLLQTITHSSGRQLQFHYEIGPHGPRIQQVRAVDEVVLAYEYEAANLVAVVHADGRRRQYHYEDQHTPSLLTGITAEGGERFSWYAYDAQARVVCSQHAPGCDLPSAGTNGVRLQYPADGSTRVSDALGAASTYHWSGAASGAGRQLVQRDDAAGQQQWRYAATGARALQAYRDRRGAHTTYQREQQGSTRIEHVTEADGSPEARRRSTGIDTANNRVTWTQDDALRVTYAYGAGVSPTRIEARDTGNNMQRVTALAYCGPAEDDCGYAGQLRRRTDTQGQTLLSYYTQDDAACASGNGRCDYRRGDLRSRRNALGHEHRYDAYDAQGRLLRERDANGVVREYTYTPRGQLATDTLRGPTAAQDRTQRFSWTAWGALQHRVSAAGQRTSWLYDQAQRLTDIVDGAGNSLHYTLDAMGNRTAEHAVDAEDTLRHALARTFDVLGRVSGVQDAYGNRTVFSHDAQGNLQGVLDPLGRHARSDHDLLGRVSQQVGDVGGIEATTRLRHRSDDALAEVEDPSGLRTGHERNAFGETLAVHSPDAGTTQFQHDERGNVTARTDARGLTTHYHYDVLNRVLSRTGPDAALDVHYQYDNAPAACAVDVAHARGRLSQVRHARGQTDYCHDRGGAVASKQQTLDGTLLRVHYVHDADGKLTSLQLPDGTHVAYERNAHGEVTAVDLLQPGKPRENLLRDIQRAPFGPVTGWTYGNGRQLLRTLDRNYRVATINDARRDGLQLGIEHDAAGQVRSLRKGAAGVLLAQYRHDGLGRLQSATADNSDPLQLYQWDATGNRISSADHEGTRAHHYADGSHHLLNAGEQQRRYDANGNTIALGQRQFHYNADNRLQSVSEGGSERERYHYNHLGERVWRSTTTASAVHMLYDEAGHWLGDYRADGSPIQQAIWLDDFPVALLTTEADGRRHLAYVQPDHLGTPRVIIDSTRDVAVWRWPLERDAFGAQPPEQDADDDGIDFITSLRFPGQQYTAATGLNYNYQRDYDPSVGRYVQSDPIGLAGGISTYGYVEGRPLSLVDPSGLEAVGSFNNGGHRLSWERGIQFRSPEYVKFQASFYSFSLSAIATRSGSIYVGGGGQRPYSAPSKRDLRVSDVFKLGLSLSAGWANMSTCNLPEPREIDKAISGFSMSGVFGYRGVGGGIGTLGNLGTASEIGIGMGASLQFGEYHEKTDYSFGGWK